MQKYISELDVNKAGVENIIGKALIREGLDLVFSVRLLELPWRWVIDLYQMEKVSIDQVDVMNDVVPLPEHIGTYEMITTDIDELGPQLRSAANLDFD